MAESVVMPKVAIVPDTNESLSNVQLTKASKINAGNPSVFPLKADNFKTLNYETASESELNKDLSDYYTIMSKIMSPDKTATQEDLNNLTVLTSKIRNYVLTDEDYNLMVGAIHEIQAYVLKFFETDLSNKAKAMDNELNKVIGDINRFMLDLEEIYSKSPSEYPIPDNSVLRPKLELEVQKTLNYTDAIQGVVVSDSKPANPVGRSIVWFNTGESV